MVNPIEKNRSGSPRKVQMGWCQKVWGSQEVQPSRPRKIQAPFLCETSPQPSSIDRRHSRSSNSRRENHSRDHRCHHRNGSTNRTRSPCAFFPLQFHQVLHQCYCRVLRHSNFHRNDHCISWRKSTTHASNNGHGWKTLPSITDPHRTLSVTNRSHLLVPHILLPPSKKP